MTTQRAILEGGKVNNDYRNAVTKKWGRMLEGVKNPYEKFVTAVLFENQTQHLREKGISLTEASTTSGNATSFTKYIFPILRRVWPNLIANDIVSIQPMSAPVGGIFFFELKYGTNKGKVKQGDILIKDFNPYASAELIDSEDVGVGTGAVVIFTHTASFLPIQLGTLKVLQDGVVVAESDDAGDLQNVVGGTAIVVGANSVINSTTGALSVEFAVAPVLASAITIQYRYDMELNTDVMEVTLDTELLPVKAESRKFKAKWSAEASDDLKALQGLDAEAELVGGVASEISLEIDREIIKRLLDTAENASANRKATFNASVPAGVTETDHFKTLVTKMTKVSNQIHKGTHRGPANWAVVGPDVATILEQLSAHADYRPLTSSEGAGTLASVEQVNTEFGIQKIGVVNNKFTVYKDPLFPEGKILMGYKGKSFLDAGFVYAPYIPLEMTPTFNNPDDYSYSKGFRSRHAMQLVREEHYGLVDVSNAP